MNDTYTYTSLPTAWEQAPQDGVTSASIVSATEPDWSREQIRRPWEPSKQLLRAIRRYQSCRAHGRLWLPLKLYWVIVHRFWSIVTAADIPLSAHLGGGLCLPHPCGVVIHPDAVIGPNCIIFQGVTIGMNAGTQVPHLGGGIYVGCGAKILGGVTIGDHAAIGANAVVLHDVPACMTAVGVPGAS